MRHETKLKHTAMRISEMHRFGLRFLARTGDESDSMAVERAVQDRADSRSESTSRSWRDLWDPEESVRFLALWALPEFRIGSDKDEKILVPFVAAHREFFYSDKARTIPHRARAIILWPHRFDMEALWRKTMHEDYHAAAKEMAKLLRKARVDPPVFG